MKAKEFFTQEWGTGFTKATLSENNGLLEMSIEDIYSTMEKYAELRLSNVVKSLPNDDKVKAHIDTLPYYGTCTTEYNEGFEDGVKWLKEQITE